MFCFRSFSYSSTLIQLTLSYLFFYSSVNQSALAYPKVIMNKVFQLESSEKLEQLHKSIISGLSHYALFRVQETPPFYALTINSSTEQSSATKEKFKLLFFGDGHTFHRAKVVSSSRNGNHGSWSLFDAHASSRYQYQSVENLILSEKNSTDAVLPESLKYTCRQDINGVKSEIKNQLSSLPIKEAKTIIQQSRLYESVYTSHRSHRLFRDDWGTYYYIEENKAPETGERFRLWIGYKGDLKLIPVITAAHDSEGTVLVSSKAAIRLVASPSKRNAESIGAYWTEQDTQRKLLEVPVDQNQGVIFNELGIYDSLYLGSICDPLFKRSSLLLQKLVPKTSLKDSSFQ